MIVKSIDVPRTSSSKRDKRPSWYSTRVCKAAGGRNLPNPSVIEYGRGIRLWMFLVPKRDLREEEREFVETRRKHEAMLGIQTENTEHLSKFPIFSESIAYFWSFDCTCFPKAPPSHVASQFLNDVNHASKRNTDGDYKSLRYPMESLQW